MIAVVLVFSIIKVTVHAAEGTQARNRASSGSEAVDHLEAKVVEYTNEERRLNGLPPLERNAPLNFVARSHSKNMCQTRTFRHESPVFPKGWDTFAGRIKRAGVQSGGENIGYRTITKDAENWARQMVEGWMKGPAHRRNILNSQFRYIGVGISRCDNDLGYATQVFSGERGRTPSRD